MRNLLPILLLCVAIPAAAVPLTVSYQAELADDQGAPLTGAHTVVFTIYDAASNGNALWTETHPVNVSNGLIHVELGSIAVQPLDETVFDGSTRYLELEVDGGPALSPRTPLVSVPYAIRSGEASHAATADNATTADSALTADFATVAGSLQGGGSGGGWVVAGDLQDLWDNNGDLPSHPNLDWEYGIQWSPSSQVPVAVQYLTWNSGVRVANVEPMFTLSDNPSAGMSYGGFMFYVNTNDPADDTCTTANWRHSYWRIDTTAAPNMIALTGSNGCVSAAVYARPR